MISSDIAYLRSAVEPEQRPFKSRKEHAKVGAAEIRRHGRRRHARERHFAGHQRKIGQGAGHLNEFDVQAFFFEKAAFSCDKKSDLGDVEAGNRERWF